MKTILMVLVSIIFSFLFFTNITLAIDCICADGSTITADTCPVGCNPITSGGTSQPVQLTNPLPTTSIPVLLGKVIQAALGIVGSLALIMFIFGGVTWMLAAGNQERVTKGKNILVWAIVGLVVIFSAYALVRFVFTGFTGT